MFSTDSLLMQESSEKIENENKKRKDFVEFKLGSLSQDTFSTYIDTLYDFIKDEVVLKSSLNIDLHPK